MAARMLLVCLSGWSKSQSHLSGNSSAPDHMQGQLLRALRGVGERLSVLGIEMSVSKAVFSQPCQLPILNPESFEEKKRSR